MGFVRGQFGLGGGFKRFRFGDKDGETPPDAPDYLAVEYDADEVDYANNDAVSTIYDQSGNDFNGASEGTGDVLYKTDDGNYYHFQTGGGATFYFSIPDYTSKIAASAQLYAVLRTESDSVKLWRLLGESDQPAAFTETFLNNLYEPFGTTTRKDDKTPVPAFNSEWVLYRVISNNGLYQMEVNGATVFTTTNVFSKAHDNPFILGCTAPTTAWKLKYLTILNNDTTNLTAGLMTRFGL